MEEKTDWKLKFRYGKDSTPYSHYSIIASGIVGDLMDGFECRKGNAVMGMKAWAADVDESAEMMRSISSQIGFEITGKIEIYETEPSEPPTENPHGYDIQFTPFD